jgi:hypothetical protein
MLRFLGFRYNFIPFGWPMRHHVPGAVSLRCKLAILVVSGVVVLLRIVRIVLRIVVTIGFPLQFVTCYTGLWGLANAMLDSGFDRVFFVENNG